jgi:hypothetical protein
MVSLSTSPKKQKLVNWRISRAPPARRIFENPCVVVKFGGKMQEKKCLSCLLSKSSIPKKKHVMGFGVYRYTHLWTTLYWLWLNMLTNNLHTHL